MNKHIDVWSSCLGWTCGELPTPLETVIPVRRTLVNLYSAVVPLVALASTVVTPIRLCLLYCTLYYCTLTLTLTHRQPSALVALSFAFVSDFVFKFCSVHFIGYNFHSTSRLRFRLEIISIFPNSVVSVGSKQRATISLDIKHFARCSFLLLLFCAVTSPWLPGTPAHIYGIRLF